MSNLCQIVDSKYIELGFGDTEVDFEDGVFLEISNQISNIDFVADNKDNECNNSTLYSNIGYADIDVVEITENINGSYFTIGYSNSQNTFFGSPTISFPQISDYFNRFKRSTLYHHDIVDISGTSDSIQVNLPPGIFSLPPVINCTPIGVNCNIYTSDITTTSFKINNLAKEEFKINYIASQDNFIFI